MIDRNGKFIGPGSLVVYYPGPDPHSAIHGTILRSEGDGYYLIEWDPHDPTWPGTMLQEDHAHGGQLELDDE